MNNCNESYVNRSKRVVRGAEGMSINDGRGEWGLPERKEVLALGYCRSYKLKEVSVKSCIDRRKFIEAEYKLDERRAEKVTCKDISKCRGCKGPSYTRRVDVSFNPLVAARLAKHAPAGPPPITTTSYESSKSISTPLSF